MAKKSKIARNEQRKVIVERYAAKRLELKKTLVDPNIQKKRYWVPSLRRNVTLQVSAKGIKTIDVRGIDVVVAAILARGVKL